VKSSPAQGSVIIVQTLPPGQGSGSGGAAVTSPRRSIAGGTPVSVFVAVMLL